MGIVCAWEEMRRGKAMQTERILRWASLASSGGSTTHTSSPLEFSVCFLPCLTGAAWFVSAPLFSAEILPSATLKAFGEGYEFY